MMPVRKTYFIHSLGCNKNNVDSEILMTLLSERGYIRVEQPGEASRVIVNTCAFVDEAKQEAVESILALAASVKGSGSLVVASADSRTLLGRVARHGAVRPGPGNLAASALL